MKGVWSTRTSETKLISLGKVILLVYYKVVGVIGGVDQGKEDLATVIRYHND
jgi:hypothetical protein